MRTAVSRLPSLTMRGLHFFAFLLLFGPSALAHGREAGDALQGKGYLFREEIALRGRRETNEFMDTPLEDVIGAMVDHIDNYYLSQEEIADNLGRIGVERNGEIFLTLMECRRILKERVYPWENDQGKNVGEEMKSYFRMFVRHIMNKRLGCYHINSSLTNVYILGSNYLEKDSEAFKNYFETSVLPELEAISPICHRIAEFSIQILSRIVEAPSALRRIDLLFDLLGDVTKPLYTEMMDIGYSYDHFKRNKDNYGEEIYYAAQPYFRKRMEDYFMGQNGYFNSRENLEFYTRIYFNTLPKNISDQLPKIYHNLSNVINLEMYLKRRKALKAVNLFDSANSTEGKVEEFKEIYGNPSKKEIVAFETWLGIYDSLGEYNEQYGYKTIQKFRDLFLRYVYNDLHEILDGSANTEEFNRLVKGLHTTDSKVRILENLMEESNRIFKEKNKEIAANDLIERLLNFVKDGERIAEKMKRFDGEFKELKRRENEIMKHLLPLIYISDLNDVLNTRFTKEFVEEFEKIYELRLKKEIYGIYKINGESAKTQKNEEEKVEELKKEFEEEKITKFEDYIQKSIEIDFGGKYGISEYQKTQEIRRSATSSLRRRFPGSHRRNPHRSGKQTIRHRSSPASHGPSGYPFGRRFPPFY